MRQTTSMTAARPNPLPRPIASGDWAAVATSAKYRALQTGLALIGWELLAVEADVPAGKLRMELRDAGSLRLTFDARPGCSFLTRERAEVEQVKVGRKGDVFIADRIRMRFLGRQRAEGLRSGLRMLAVYIADNSAIPLPSAKSALLPIFGLVGEAA